MMATWHDVDWSKTLGGNDKYGDCTFVTLANLIDIERAPEIVSEAETERFYTVETGWTAENDGAGTGAALAVVLSDWCANGWPSDPMLKPSGFHAIAFDQIPAWLPTAKGVPAWLMLPEGVEEGTYDFSDSALLRQAPGVFAHAVLIVDVTGGDLTFITWAAPQTVSLEWAKVYFKGFYVVTL